MNYIGMIEILIRYGFTKTGERCRTCPGPYGTRWKRGKYIINEFPDEKRFSVRRNNYLIHRGAAHELDEYIKQNIPGVPA